MNWKFKFWFKYFYQNNEILCHDDEYFIDSCNISNISHSQIVIIFIALKDINFLPHYNFSRKSFLLLEKNISNKVHSSVRNISENKIE